MEVIIKVSSSYFEIDTSKYRLAISELTLIESLKQQTDKDFTVVLDVAAMDPCYTKRIAAFKAIGVKFKLDHDGVVRADCLFTLITVDDDTFLHSELVATVKRMTVYPINCRLLAPNGYVFRSGILQVCSEKPDFVEIIQFVQGDYKVRGEVSFTKSHCWIHTRHKRNNSLVFDQKTSNEIKNLSWPGWQPGILQKFCAVRVVEATAQGCTLEPMRSKSVVIASRSKRKRRKRG